MPNVGGRVEDPTACPACKKKWSMVLQHNKGSYADKQMIKMQVGWGGLGGCTGQGGGAGGKGCTEAPAAPEPGSFASGRAKVHEGQDTS